MYTVITKGNKVHQYLDISRIISEDDVIILDKEGLDVGGKGNPISWPTDATNGLQVIVDVKAGTLRFGHDELVGLSECVVCTYGGSGTVPKPAPHIFDVINHWPQQHRQCLGIITSPEGWEWKWFGDDWVLSNSHIGLTRADWFKYNNKQVEASPVETKTVTAASMLQSALGHMEDRAKTYDAPGGERSMGKTVSAFNTITGLQLSEEQGWLFMEILKQVRSQQGNYRADNYEDMVAYAALRGECAARERGNK